MWLMVSNKQPSTNVRYYAFPPYPSHRSSHSSPSFFFPLTHVHM